MDEIEKVDAETTEIKSEGVEETKDAESEEKTTTTETEEKEVVAETPEAKKARLERQLKQHNKKYGFEKAEERPASKQKKSDEFDEAQLAYLTVKGIDSDEDIDWTREQLKERGGTLRELLGKKWFQAELKERKEAKTVLEATPTTSKRGSSKAPDMFELEYAKYQQTGKLPANREMAEKVIAKRREQESSTNVFTDNPVVGNY